MNNLRHRLSKRYVKRLSRYLAKENEAGLHQAYDFGRHAIARGLGVLDMAKMHQSALSRVLFSPLLADRSPNALSAAETFFMEALSPFEVAHRGFRDAHRKQRQLIQILEGQNARLAAMNHDLENEIAERQRMEEMWKRYESIVNTSKDFMTLISSTFRYEAANDSYCRSLGRKREEIVGHTVSEVWGREIFLKIIKKNLEKCFAGNDVHYEAWFEVPNLGKHCFDVSYYPYHRDGQVTHGIVVTRDITERKQAEGALRQSEEHYRQLFNESRLMQENLRNLSNKILHVQEEERKRISRELHDEVGQILTAINVNLAMLRKGGISSTPDLKKRMDDTQNLLQQSMETVHRFARELRPAMLDDLGLIPALRSYIAGFTERTEIRVRFTASPAAERLDSEKKTVLYRVAQESLTNVAKHARASKVDITLRQLINSVRIEIKDNGQAFQIESNGSAKGKKRLGLLGMQERVRLVKGDFSIKSEPGKGTVVRVEIPFQAEGLSRIQSENDSQKPSPRWVSAFGREYPVSAT